LLLSVAKALVGGGARREPVKPVRWLAVLGTHCADVLGQSTDNSRCQHDPRDAHSTEVACDCPHL